MKTTVKILAALAVLAAAFTLCGCEKLGTELSELMIMQGIGVDKIDGGYRVTVEILNNEQLGSAEGGVSSDLTRVYSCEGETVSQALYKLPSLNGNTPFFAHNRVIVLGESAVKDGIDEVLDFFERDFNSRPTQLICAARECEAADILNGKLPSGDVRSEILDDILQEAYNTTSAPRVRVIDAANRLNGETATLCLPAVTMKKEGKYDVYALDGCAAFNIGGAFGTYTSAEASGGIQMLDGKINRGEITAVTENGKHASFVILSGKTSYKVSIVNGKPSFTVTVKLLCDLNTAEGELPYSDDGDYIKSLESSAEQAVCDTLTKTVGFLQAEKLDAARFARRLECADAKGYNSVKNDWSSVFTESEVKIGVDVTLRRIGEETFHIKKR